MRQDLFNILCPYLFLYYNILRQQLVYPRSLCYIIHGKFCKIQG